MFVDVAEAIERASAGIPIIRQTWLTSPLSGRYLATLETADSLPPSFGRSCSFHRQNCPGM